MMASPGRLCTLYGRLPPVLRRRRLFREVTGLALDVAGHAVMVSVLNVSPRSAVGTVRLRSPRAWIGRQRGGLRAPCRENSGLAALAVRTFLLKFGTSSPYRSSLLYLAPCCRLSPTGARSVGAGVGGVGGGEVASGC